MPYVSTAITVCEGTRDVSVSPRQGHNSSPNMRIRDAEPAQTDYCGTNAVMPVGPTSAPRVDPWMSDSYFNLPDLSGVDVVPYFGGSFPVLDTFTATTIRAVYSSRRNKEFLAVRLYQAITATHFDVYINPSRAHPNQVESAFEYGVTYFRIPRHIQNPGRDWPPKNVCFLSTGVTCYSHLCTPYASTLGNSIVEDRRIGIYPIEYEFQRGLAFLGTAANKNMLHYSFSAGALHFVTRTKEFCSRMSARAVAGRNDGFMGLHYLGDQNDAIFNVVTRNYPHALNFGCYVPIFDARNSTFVFNRGHFHCLSALPLFEGEVPHGALVTVGHTACIFHGPGDDPTVRSPSGVAIFFVQFIVLHSL